MFARLPGLLVLAAILAGCGTQPADSNSMSSASSKPVIRTVFLIMMENHNWSDIKGNSSAPYINHTLLPMGSHAEGYYNPPGLHPSLPNYLWLEAGVDFGIHADFLPGEAQQATHNHLVSLLDRAGISWRSYQEGITGRECPLAPSGLYAPKHDPFVYFRDVTGRRSYCIAHVRPYAALADNLRRNTIARYSMITPDLCHDMHDTCPPSYNRVSQGDRWLSHALPPILHSSAYRNGGAIFITWDEGEGSDGPIGMIALSPAAKGHGYIARRRYTHSSTLRTLQEIFRVKPLLGDARKANDLRDLFTHFP